MYAIVQVGGRQYRASAGDRIVVDRMAVEPGEKVELSDVRMLVAEEGDPGETMVGRPSVDGALVRATALGHLRGRKILVFKYKPKKRYRRTKGFRADLTELLVDGFAGPGEVPTAEEAPPPRRTRARAAKPALDEPAVGAGATEVSEATPRAEPAVDAAPGPAPAAGTPEAGSSEAKPTPRRRRAKAAEPVAEAPAEGGTEAISGDSSGA